MPQAEKDLADRITARFGSLSDHGPMKFLSDAGYGARGDFLWEPKPGVASHNDMTAEEWDCLLFLVQEWDFGGLASPKDPACPILSVATKDPSAAHQGGLMNFASRKDAPADAFGPLCPEQLGMTEEEIAAALNEAEDPKRV